METSEGCFKGMMPLMYDVQERQTYREGRFMEVGMGINCPWHKASYRGDEVLKLTHADGCTTQWLLEVTVYCKWLDFMTREV